MEIIGQKPNAIVRADIGSGHAIYALIGGGWYSVNMMTDYTITDVRWRCGTKDSQTLNKRIELDI